MKKCDVILVLGLRLNEDGSARQELKDRVRIAADLFRQGAAPRVVACGGPTGGENTEADVMAQLLIAQGVPDENIIREDKSMITRENIANARALLGKGHFRAALVTSDYHMFRSAQLCRRADFSVEKHPSRVPFGWYKRDCIWLEVLYTLENMLPPKPDGRETPPLVDFLFGPAMKRVEDNMPG